MIYMLYIYSALQFKILDRMRSFGMLPVLPAFSGIVPQGIVRYDCLFKTVSSIHGFRSIFLLLEYKINSHLGVFESVKINVLGYNVFLDCSVLVCSIFQALSESQRDQIGALEPLQLQLLLRIYPGPP